MREDLEEKLEGIKSILKASMGLDVTWTIPPYESLAEKRERQFIEMLSKTNPDVVAVIEKEFERLMQGGLLQIQGETGYTVYIYKTDAKDGLILKFGPFFSYDNNNKELMQFFQDVEASPSMQEMLIEYYHELPFFYEANVLAAIRAALHVLEEPIDGNEIQHLNLPGKFKPKFSTELSETHALLLERSERLYDVRTQLCDSVRKGFYETGYKIVKEYLQIEGFYSISKISSEKTILLELNTILENSLHQTTVHPYFRRKWMIKLRDEIEQANDITKIRALPAYMIKKYCELVNNHACSKYSTIIQRAIDYVKLHIDEVVTLQIIAKELKKSEGYLSALFKEEVGITLTEFVQREKMNEATKLLSKGMKVNEVAIQVGIANQAYFSQVFKKHYQMTPQQYQKKICFRSTKMT